MTLIARVLTTLLREDHLGMHSDGEPDGDWWRWRHLRLPVEPDGFLADHRVAKPFLEVRGRRLSTLDAVLAALAPVDDPEAERGWAAFTEECHAAERDTPDLRDELAPLDPMGFAGLLHYEALAATLEHPVHPAGRARLGLTEAELRAYAPEYRPRFRLRQANGLPVHPLIVARGLVEADELGPEVIPTLSMRTVALADDPGVHLKLPLPTATLGARNTRSIKQGTLADGAEMQRLLAKVLAAEPALADTIVLADESVWVDDPDEYRAALTRRYPSELDGAHLVPLAALAAPDPWGTGTVLDRVAGGDLDAWFDRYLRVLLDFHVALWLRYGIALESHQQNITLALAGDRIRLVYKDNDGARVDPTRQQAAFADRRMAVADPAELADVFTTITLHLCAAATVRAAGRDDLFSLIGRRLAEAADRWTDPTDPASVRAAELLRTRVLEADRLPVKAMVTAGTLLPKHRLGCTDINKHYLRTGPNYLRHRSSS
ncbi:IucA/IucC family protein [Labedaea rhizosphaerae]|uniref:Siderophore synthetase component n=1 Tax=Labedaea rhizosphaerae TaxID=598644 RepID=A0A4R6S5D3_LABRH|nr:IucA/IucC family protein [Labedaea rhizosphaerae]TDP93956.1 siderophore synthetase component [Labedaea rhizosphaerae]